MLTQTEIYYRYEFYSYSRIPELETYPVIKRTPKSAVIMYNGKLKYITESRNLSWVTKKPIPTKKRFAYPTKEEALTAFKARKKRQLAIIKQQVEQVEHILHILKTFDLNENPLVEEKKYNKLYDLFDFNL
jgi:hypothetical protein